MSKDEVLKALQKLFPDRPEKSMKSTINVQVPNRINKERDFDLVKMDNGNYKVK